MNTKLTVVYDADTIEDVQELLSAHPWSAMSHTHAIHERDAALREVERLQKRVAEMQEMLAAPAQPVAGQSRFKGDDKWGWCSHEHATMVLATPSEWEGYEVRYLYAAPHPAAKAQDAKDAARYRFLRDGEWRETPLESVVRLQLDTLWDTKIDAAIAAAHGIK